MHCCRVRAENVILSEGKNDPTTHLHLDHEKECMDDDDIIGVYSVSDVVCSSTISQLIRQLEEK
jgi:hypothetical protein